MLGALDGPTLASAARAGGRLLLNTFIHHPVWVRYYRLLLAESHLTRRRVGSMLQRIWTPPVPTG